MKNQILINLTLMISFVAATPTLAQVKVLDVTNDERFQLNIDDSPPLLEPPGNSYGIVPAFCQNLFDSFECFQALFDDGSGFPIFDGAPSPIGLDLLEFVEPGSGQPIIADESFTQIDPDTVELRISLESTNGASLYPAEFLDSSNQPLEVWGLFVGESAGGNPVPLPEPMVFVTDATLELSDADGELVVSTNDLNLNFGDNEAGWDGSFGVILFNETLNTVTKIELTVQFDGILDFTCGDVNLDGSVTLTDIQPFVELLTTGDYQIEADINLDGVVDLLDIQGFVQKIGE